MHQGQHLAQVMRAVGQQIDRLPPGGEPVTEPNTMGAHQQEIFRDLHARYQQACKITPPEEMPENMQALLQYIGQRLQWTPSDLSQLHAIRPIIERVARSLEEEREMASSTPRAEPVIA